MKSSYTQSCLFGNTGKTSEFFLLYLIIKLFILNKMFLKIVVILLICFMICEEV